MDEEIAIVVAKEMPVVSGIDELVGVPSNKVAKQINFSLAIVPMYAMVSSEIVMVDITPTVRLRNLPIEQGYY